MLAQHSHAVAKALEKVSLQPALLEPQGIGESSKASPDQAEFEPPIEPLPDCECFLAVAEFRFPLLAPIRPQPAGDNYSDEPDQPQPYANASRVVEFISHTDPDALKPLLTSLRGFATRIESRPSDRLLSRTPYRTS